MVNDTEIKGSYIESLWNFFASVKLTVVVLSALAALSIIGTLIPQNEDPAQYFKVFGPFLFQVLSTLDIFDMYRSWWFQGLIIILVVNIIICSIDRLQITGKIIFTKNPKFNLGSYRNRKGRKDFYRNGNPSALKETFEALLSKEYGFCEVVPAGEGVAITAEKGRLTRLGVYGVHLSIVILLIGSLMGSLGGFEGFAQITEGEATDTIHMRFSDGTMKLPFAIQCDDFDVQFYDTGAPKEFRSKLTIIENGQQVLQKDIIVNDPLRYKGINIFQSSWGKIDNPGGEMDTSKEIELSFTSMISKKVYKVKAAMKKTVDMPEGLGQFVIDDFHKTAEFRGQPVGAALVGTLTPKEGKSQQIVLPIKFPRFDMMRRGKVVISVVNTGELFDEKFYTGLQITKDPGVGMVYTGFTLMILGCIVTFFMAHQQVVVEIQPKKTKVRIMVSGKTNKNKVGFQYKIERLADKLESLDLNKSVN